MEDATLAEVLGGIVDANPEIIEIEDELHRRLVDGLPPRAVLGSPIIASDINLVLQAYRCEIVAVVAATLEDWKAATVR